MIRHESHDMICCDMKSLFRIRLWIPLRGECLSFGAAIKINSRFPHIGCNPTAKCPHHADTQSHRHQKHRGDKGQHFNHCRQIQQRGMVVDPLRLDQHFHRNAQ